MLRKKKKKKRDINTKSELAEERESKGEESIAFVCFFVKEFTEFPLPTKIALLNSGKGIPTHNIQ